MLLTKEMLEYEYEICGSMQKIADKYNISVDSVYKYMKLHNINYNKHYTGIYTCNHNAFEIQSPESFYLAGFIAADGSLQNRRYSKILKITLSIKDIDHLHKIRDCLKADNPISCYNVKPSKLVKTRNKSCELQIVSEKIFDDLSKFNIVPNKTKNYDFPDWLMDHEFVSHYMRGYFDGDGFALNRERSFGIVGNLCFVEKYQQILIKNCELNKTKLQFHNNVFIMRYNGNNNLDRVYDFIYKNSTIHLNRKENLLRKRVVF